MLPPVCVALVLLAPIGVPHCVLTPVHAALLHGTIVASHWGCVCWWGLVRCVGMRGLTVGFTRQMMMNDESMIVHCLVAMLLIATWHLKHILKNEGGMGWTATSTCSVMVR